jgi:hypothetical protein
MRILYSERAFRKTVRYVLVSLVCAFFYLVAVHYLATDTAWLTDCVKLFDGIPEPWRSWAIVASFLTLFLICCGFVLGVMIAVAAPRND